MLFFGVTAPPASAGAPFAPAVTGLSVVAMMRSSRCVLVVVGLVGLVWAVGLAMAAPIRGRRGW